MPTILALVVQLEASVDDRRSPVSIGSPPSSSWGSCYASHLIDVLAVSRRAKSNSCLDMKYLSSSPSCLLFLFGDPGELVDLFVAAVAAIGVDAACRLFISSWCFVIVT
eukprot:917433-Amphidinium_carterae.2